MSYRKSEGNAVFLIDTIPQTNINAPMVAVGKVVITKTAEREPTQNPMTGFVCDGTPLGKGHIIALFLGGPDIPENYAPQYEQWQQGGKWKTMEQHIEKLSTTTGNSVDLYMVVNLTYKNNGNTYNAELTKFANNEIFNWTDREIPTGFEIKTFKSNDNGAAAFIADLFGANDGKAVTALTAIATASSPAKELLTAYKDFSQTAMPDEDYKYWLKNLVRDIANEAAAQAHTDYTEFMKTNTTRITAAAAIATVSKPVASGKRGRHKAPSTAVVSRRSLRFDPVHKKLEEDARARFGFTNNDYFSPDTWKTDKSNLTKLRDAVKTKLDTRTDHYGVKLADYSALAGGNIVASNTISAYLTK